MTPALLLVAGGFVLGVVAGRLPWPVAVTPMHGAWVVAWVGWWTLALSVEGRRVRARWEWTR